MFLDVLFSSFDTLLGISFYAFVDSSPIFLVALVTSFGIAALSVFVGTVEITRIIIWRIESMRLWSLLNFEKKPMQASAVVVISLFTILYWPVVLLVTLL